MARTFGDPFPCSLESPRICGDQGNALCGGIFFRALVDLGTGNVAGIEPAHPGCMQEDLFCSEVALSRSEIENKETLGAVVRDAAAFLVRGDLTTHPDRISATLGVEARRTILMFDVADLFSAPVQALDVLLECKRAGARVLLDNFDLDDPPARFMSMLPADILRVAPDTMPWHWDAARRRQALESVLGFAGNLLMDVAVVGANEGEQQREYKKLGVRYIQGSWRRDPRGIVPTAFRL